MLAVFLILVALLGAGCRAATDSAAAPDARRTPLPSPSQGPLVAFLGDSLTAGWNIDEEQAYPALLGRALSATHHPIRVLNAGVSGDTAAGGLRRLPWVLKQKPDIVVVALGANDGLRGLDLPPLEGALREILAQVKASGARALLVGMRIPPNMGPDYAARFEAIYPRVAQEAAVPLVPFLLEGVAGKPELNFDDGVHPRAAGHERIAQNVLPRLREVVAEAGRGR
jgi:acyl-CoA thioesterase-1